MRQKTVTRADITDAVHRQIGLSRSDAEKLVKQTIEEIINGLIKEDIVKIASFGSFIVRRKQARMGRNPKTGEDTEISPRRVLTFRAGEILKDYVQNSKSKSGGSHA